MTADRDPARRSEPALVERQVQRIVNSRSVTLGLAVLFLVLALGGAIVMRIVDQGDFPSLGTAVWWALQTVTTVGYGDVVPTTATGRVVGGIEMVLGVSFIAFVTAGVTSAVIRRGAAEATAAEQADAALSAKTIVDGLTETRNAIAELHDRLGQIEARLTD